MHKLSARLTILLLAGSCLVAAAGLLTGCGKSDAKSKGAKGGGKGGGMAAGQMPPMPVEVADVAPGIMRDRFRAVGSIQAADVVDVASELNAVVRSLPFREGQAVRRGQVLA